MAVLKERGTKEVDLLTIKGGKIVCYDSLNGSDVEEMLKISEGGQQSSVVKPLTRLIKSWNLTDEKGNALDVNAENVGKLDMKDLYHILKEVGFDKSDFFGLGSEGSGKS